MKRIVSIVLLLAMCASLFAGCKKDDTPESGSSSLKDAVAYLESMYNTAGKGEVMELISDKDVLSVVTIEGVSYEVAWSISITEGAADSVKIGESSKANHVTIDIPEKAETDILFTATATVKDADGNTEAVSLSYKVAASAFGGMTDEEVVEQAYLLESGESMESAATLTGVITRVKTPYDADYQNITVIIQIGELDDKKIECYRLKGDGCDELAVGDTITVTGILKNYNGTIEFDSGCVLDEVVPGERVQAPEDPKEILADAYALEAGTSLAYEATLTGKIIEIKTPYDESYGNISVIIEIDGAAEYPMLCYRLKGEGADTLAVGDTITVVGYICNYNGTIEYEAGCKLTAVTAGDGDTTTSTGGSTSTGGNTSTGDSTSTTKPSTLDGQIKAALALAEGEKLSYTSTMTGKITKINEEYSADYQNITVTIEYNGTSYKIYRTKGNGAEGLAVGDTITVTGYLQNWYGDVQMSSGSNLDKVVKGEQAPTSQTDIVNAAYALEKGESLDYQATLTGVITRIKTPYSEQYSNITVVIQVGNLEDKKIECYRLKGDGCEELAIGDTITVTGLLKNYNGTIEFDASCTLDKVVPGAREEAPSDPKQILKAAYALEVGKSLAYEATLTGKIIKIETAYDASYGNISVIIEIDGATEYPILCYRLKGDGAEGLAVGDKITVVGYICNYNGTIEYESGCTFVLA